MGNKKPQGLLLGKLLGASFYEVKHRFLILGLKIKISASLQKRLNLLV